MPFCNTGYRFKVFVLVVVGAEADDVEDGGGDEDVGRYSEQLSTKDQTNLNCFQTIPLLFNLCGITQLKVTTCYLRTQYINLYTLMHDLVLLQLPRTEVPQKR